jgi:hypothetical protein
MENLSLMYLAMAENFWTVHIFQSRQLFSLSIVKRSVVETPGSVRQLMMTRHYHVTRRVAAASAFLFTTTTSSAVLRSRLLFFIPKSLPTFLEFPESSHFDIQR